MRGHPKQVCKAFFSLPNEQKMKRLLNRDDNAWLSGLQDGGHCLLPYTDYIKQCQIQGLRKCMKYTVALQYCRMFTQPFRSKKRGFTVPGSIFSIYSISERFYSRITMRWEIYGLAPSRTWVLSRTFVSVQSLWQFGERNLKQLFIVPSASEKNWYNAWRKSFQCYKSIKTDL